MPPFDRKPEMLREQVEPAALERRHEPARHPQRAQHRIGESDAEDAPVFEVEKSKVEGRVVRDHHAVAHELAKRGQHCSIGGASRIISVVIDVSPVIKRGTTPPCGRTSCRESLGEPLTNHSVGADLDDRAGPGASAGGFQIDDRELGLVEPDAEAIALREPPLRRVGVEDEIRIAAEQLANKSRAEFRVRADSAQQQPDQLARVGTRRPRAQELIELLLGRNAEMALIRARYFRFFHLRTFVLPSL